MADVVLNHVGYGDTAHGYNPFYKDEYFHNCSVLRAQGVGARCNLLLRGWLLPKS